MRTEQEIFDLCVRAKLPYFGPHMRAEPGDIVRHRVLFELARQAIADNPWNAPRILEIGSWVGASAFTWGEAILQFGKHGGEIFCVDAWEPYFVPEETSPASSVTHLYRDAHRALSTDTTFFIFSHNVKHSPFRNLITTLRSTSDKILPLLKPESFDLVYVDGSHAYSQVKKDLIASLPLVRDGGIICGDDLEAQLMDVDAGAAQALREKDMSEDPRTGKWIHPGVTLAVWEQFGEVKTAADVWALRRNGNSWESFLPAPADKTSLDDGVHIRGSRYLIEENAARGRCG